MTALSHITLDTGHVRQSPRHEAGAEAVAILQASLAMALEQPRSRVPVPSAPGFSYGATAEGGTLMVTIWGTVQRQPAPVVTFGVAPIGSDAAGLWQVLHGARGGLEDTPFATDVGRPPATPWLAARIEIGAGLMQPADLLWMADFERCVAWAWIERP